MERKKVREERALDYNGKSGMTKLFCLPLHQYYKEYNIKILVSYYLDSLFILQNPNVGILQVLTDIASRQCRPQYL